MNYFEYFSEVEERFTVRRGSVLLLSTLDWALIETWREAGIPLEAVLRGIDEAFDKYEQRRSRAKGRLPKVNGLAWCSQAVMEAALQMADASVGAHPEQTTARVETGFESHKIALYLERNAHALMAIAAGDQLPKELLQSTAGRLQELASSVRTGQQPALDELDRILTVLDERLQGVVLANTAEEELVALRHTAESELRTLRRHMSSAQIRQTREQFVAKSLFEKHQIPRLSLFYMPVNEVEG